MRKNVRDVMDGYMRGKDGKGYNKAMFPNLEHYDFCEATEYPRDWLKRYLNNKYIILYVKNIKSL